jgi:hypothetical protein
LERGPASEQSEPHVIRTIADFEFSELMLQKTIGSEKLRHRTISFFLIGPNWPWQPTRILTTDQYGNVQIEELDPESPIMGIDDISVSVHTRYLTGETNRSATLPSQRHNRERNSPHREFRIGAEVCTIEMHDRLKGRTCDDFVKRAIQLVDGMALAASFFSKASLTWYSYHLLDDQNLIAYYRSQQNEPDKRADWEESVINPAEAKAFISTATSTLVCRSADGLDIRTIIILYLTAQKMPFLEEKFAICYRALENGVSQLRNLTPTERLLSKEDIAELRGVAETLLRERRVKDDSIQIVSKKLGNLAQPDFLKQLETTLNSIRVNFDDLGGAEALKSIYKSRNRIFHSHRSSFDELVTATAQLETLLERVIISLMRWSGPITSPTYLNRLTLK